MKLVTYADDAGTEFPGVVRGDEVVRLDVSDMRWQRKRKGPLSH